MYYFLSLTGKGLTLLACLVMAGTLQAQCVNNLVVNGDMDTNVDPDTPNLPDGYFTDTDGIVSTSIVNSPFDGTSAANVTINSSTFGSYGTQVTNIVEGLEYNWNADVEVTSGAANLLIIWQDANGDEVDRSVSNTITTADGPTALSLIAPAPSGLGVAQAEIAVSFSNSSVTVDNFCLTESTCEGNLYTNGSYEDPDAPGPFFPSNTGTQSVVEDGTTGRYALSVGAGTGGGFRLIGAGPGTFEPGDQIELTAQAKSTNGGLVIAYNFNDGSPQTYDSTSLATNATDFTEIQSGILTVPANVRNFTVFTTRLDPLILDDVCLVKVSALPIDLTSLTGRALQKSNRIVFTVANQQNTENFYVERREGAQSAWSVVATLAAAGTTENALTYTVDDEVPTPVAYYRVRSVDFDGLTQYSKVITIERNDAWAVTVYPNPVGEVFTVETNLTEATEFQLFDGLGRRLRVGRVSAGFQRTRVSTARLPGGRYLLRVGDRVVQVVK